MKTLYWILFVLLILAAWGVFVMKNNMAANEVYTYVITETDPATSLDPLDADTTTNLPVARMIYATPLEIDNKGFLTSKVLQDFKYDQASNTINWTARAGLKYSDGSDITPEDIAFSVARMAYTRPSFPVLEDIEGVSTWVKEPHPLKSYPAGIKVDGSKITIHFAKKQEHPLFRFCLEIFSIIPKKCVNLETNKLSCADIPASGYYVSKSKTPNTWEFEKRDSEKIHGDLAPKFIRFEYWAPEATAGKISSINNQTILSGNELKHSLDEMGLIKNHSEVVFTPAARIAVMLVNPEVEPFNDEKCRQVFAHVFRNTFAKFVKGTRPVESSVFTALLPGYLESSQLDIDDYGKLTPEEIRSCKEKIKNHPLKWTAGTAGKNTLFANLMARVFEELEIPKQEPIPNESIKNISDSFSSGQVSIIMSNTGFWAFDPASDVQMLLTPNMHKALQFVARDEELQGLIRNLKADGGIQPEAFKKLNRYLHTQGLFNVFTHVRRFYAAKDKSLIMDAPVSITSPAPWQVFRLER